MKAHDRPFSTRKEKKERVLDALVGTRALWRTHHENTLAARRTKYNLSKERWSVQPLSSTILALLLEAFLKASAFQTVQMIAIESRKEDQHDAARKILR